MLITGLGNRGPGTLSSPICPVVIWSCVNISAGHQPSTARLVLPAQPVPLKQPSPCGQGEAALPVLSPTFSELPQRLTESMSLASPATGIFPAPCWVTLIKVSPQHGQSFSVMWPHLDQHWSYSVYPSINSQLWFWSVWGSKPGGPQDAYSSMSCCCRVFAEGAAVMLGMFSSLPQEKTAHTNSCQFEAGRRSVTSWSILYPS